MTAREREDIRRVATAPLPWELLAGKTLLISGGTGFLGSFLCDVFRYRNAQYGDGIRVISLSRNPREDDGTVSYRRADVTAPVPLADRIDYILHLASNTHPAQYAADPVGTITGNVLGCLHLLELAREQGVTRFLLASSVEIYGEGSPDPMDESRCGYLDCATPRAGYNEAKRLSESLCASFRAQYGVDSVTVRFSRIFGADRKQDTKAMAQFLRDACAGRDIVLKSKGEQRFSYCYVADAVLGLLTVLLRGAGGEAYNLAGEDEGKTLADYAAVIAGHMGRRVIFDLGNTVAGASRATCALLNTDKIKALGFAPLYGVSEALCRTLDIYTDRAAEE